MEKFMGNKSSEKASQKIFSAQEKKLALHEAVLKFDEKLNISRGKNRELLIERISKQSGLEKDLEKLRRYHKQEQKLNKKNLERVLKSLKKESLAIRQRQEVLRTNLSNFIKANPSLSEGRGKPDDDHAWIEGYFEGSVTKDYYSELQIKNFGTTFWGKDGLQQITAYKRSKLFVIRELIYYYTPTSNIKMTIRPFIMANGHYWEHTIDTCFEDNIAEVGFKVKVFAEQTAPNGDVIRFGQGIPGHVKDIWAEGADRQLDGHSSDGNNQVGNIEFYGNWDFGPIFLWADRKVTITVLFELYSHVRGEYSEAYIDFYSFQPEESIIISCVELETELV